MAAEVSWSRTVIDALLEVPPKEVDLIVEKVERLREFPEMYPMRGRGPFRRCRWFLAGNWIVYYQTDRKEVYVRAVWPAHLP